MSEIPSGDRITCIDGSQVYVIGDDVILRFKGKLCDEVPDIAIGAIVRLVLDEGTKYERTVLITKISESEFRVYDGDEILELTTL